jgi:dihydropteroate synthase
VGAFVSVLQRAAKKRGVLLMGVCNVTPDSFSDGGRYLSPDAVDIGGESTRPGAAPVSPEEQLARVLPAVRYAAKLTTVSVDTTHPRVAEACLEAGACLINDVSCLADDALADVVARFRAPYILMHARGPQAKMAGFSAYPDAGYADVVDDVLREWHAAAERARGRGVDPAGLVMDPGLGFAKNARQSAELLANVRKLSAEAGVPVLVGASRKSFLKLWDETAGADERLGASVAAAALAARTGARIVRVHDVRATRQAIDLLHALRWGDA